MSLRRLVCKWAVLLAPLAVAASAPAARAQSCAADGCAAGSTCATPGCGSICAVCQIFHCPPPLVHRAPNPPKVKIKCTCPKLACDPCHLDPTGNYGYTPTRWRPWTAEPNYAHCPVLSPTQIMLREKVEVAPPVPLAPPSPDKELSPTRLESQGPTLAPETRIPTTLPEPESLPEARTESRLPPPPPPLDTRLPPLPR
jgi:hypothetical protein